MAQINDIAVFVFDANAYDKSEIDALAKYSDYQSLLAKDKDHIAYFDMLSAYENNVNEYYMAADTFVKFVAKE